MTTIWEGILVAAQVAWDLLKLYFEGYWTIISTVFTTAWNIISTVLTTVWNTLVNVGTTLWNGLKTAITTIMDGIKTGITTAWETLKGAVITIMSTLAGWVVGAWNGLKSTVVSIATGIKDGAVRAWNKLTGEVKRIVGSVKSAFNGLRNIDLFEAGMAIINGFRRGLESAFEGVKNFVGGIATWIKNNKGPIAYDRRLLIPAGNAIMEGLNDGLSSEFETVKKSVSSMTGDIQDAVSNDEADAFTINASPFFEVVNDMKEAVDDLLNLFDELSGKKATLGSANYQSSVYTGGASSPFNSSRIIGGLSNGVQRYGQPQSSGSVIREIGDLQVTVVSELDGREVARNTYPFTKQFIEREAKFNRRSGGELA